MNRRRAFLLALAAILLGLAGWYLASHRAVIPATGAGARDPQAVESGPAAKSAGLPAVPPEPRSTMADALNSPATDARGDLKLLGDIFDAYRTNLRLNPVGSNAEITAALTGKNTLHLALVPRDHPAVNAGGELCDRWGTPFFFHQLSGTQMEIHSAGPDRKMWTEDDLVFTP